MSAAASAQIPEPVTDFSFLVSAEDWARVEPPDDPVPGSPAAYFRKNGQKGALKGWGDLLINKYIEELNPCCRFRVSQAGAFLKPHSAKAKCTPYFTAKIECQCRTCDLKCKVTVAEKPSPGSAVLVAVERLCGTFCHLVDAEGNPSDPGRRSVRGLARKQLKEELLASNMGPLEFSKAKAASVSALAETSGNYSKAPSDVVMRKLLSEIYNEDLGNPWVEVESLGQELGRDGGGSAVPGFVQSVDAAGGSPRHWGLWEERQVVVARSLLRRQDEEVVAFLDARGDALRSMVRHDASARRFLAYTLVLRPSSALCAQAALDCPVAELDSFHHEPGVIARWLTCFSRDVEKVNEGASLRPAHFVSDFSHSVFSAAAVAFNGRTYAEYAEDAFLLVQKTMSLDEIKRTCWLHVAAASTLGAAQAALQEHFDVSFRNILCGLISAPSLGRLEELIHHAVVVLKSETVTGDCEESIRRLHEVLEGIPPSLSSLAVGEAELNSALREEDAAATAHSPFYHHFKPLVAAANNAAAQGDPYGELEVNPYYNPAGARYLIEKIRDAHLWTGITVYPLRYAAETAESAEVESGLEFFFPTTTLEPWFEAVRDKVLLGKPRNLTPVHYIKAMWGLTHVRILEAQQRLRRSSDPAARVVAIHSFRRRQKPRIPVPPTMPTASPKRMRLVSGGVTREVILFPLPAAQTPRSPGDQASSSAAAFSVAANVVVSE